MANRAVSRRIMSLLDLLACVPTSCRIEGLAWTEGFQISQHGNETQMREHGKGSQRMHLSEGLP